MGVCSVQLFEQARWQAELVALDVGREYQLEKALPLAEAVLQAAAEAVAVVQRLEPEVARAVAVAVAESAPGLVSQERVAAIQAGQAEVTRALEFLQGERTAILQQVTREREAALTALRQFAAEERQALTEDAERTSRRVVDHAMRRLERQVRVGGDAVAGRPCQTGQLPALAARTARLSTRTNSRGETSGPGSVPATLCLERNC